MRAYLRCFNLLFVIATTTYLLSFVDSRPLRIGDVKKLLVNYGYLKNNDSNNSVSTSQAIQSFQKYFGINVTGKLDKPTLQLMHSKRCGQPDILSHKQIQPKLKTLSNQMFSSNQFRGNKFVKFYYLYNDTLPNGLDPVIVYGALEYAFNVWAAVTNLNFIPAERGTEPDIFIGFYRGNHSDGYSFDGKGNVIAHSATVSLPSQTFSFIHYDKDDDWVINRTSQYRFHVPAMKKSDEVDFVLATIHEMGHLLGFNHVSPLVDSIMQSILPTLPSDEYKLRPYDIKHVQSIYGKCEAEQIDSIFSINGLTYIIVGQFTYLLNDQRIEVEQSWPRVTMDVFGIDYITEGVEHSDGFVYFFSRKGYQVKMVHQDMSQITVLQYQAIIWKGLIPSRPIDGMFVHQDGHTYIFQHNLVFKWENQGGTINQLPNGKVASGWPKMISQVFPGVPDSIDTVFRWPKDGRVYFFKDRYFYIWDENKNKADGFYPTYQWKNICNVFKCKTKSDCLKQWSIPSN